MKKGGNHPATDERENLERMCGKRGGRLEDQGVSSFIIVPVAPITAIRI
jgi:hypothetical protein